MQMDLGADDPQPATIYSLTAEIRLLLGRCSSPCTALLLQLVSKPTHWQATMSTELSPCKTSFPSEER